MSLKAIKVIVSGQVQGVGFRNWTKVQAQALGLTGTVRNLHNGDVEAIFYGEEAALHKILNLLKVGPAFARVDNVTAEEIKLSEPHLTFKII